MREVLKRSRKPVDGFLKCTMSTAFHTVSRLGFGSYGEASTVEKLAFFIQ